MTMEENDDYVPPPIARRDNKSVTAKRNDISDCARKTYVFAVRFQPQNGISMKKKEKRLHEFCVHVHAQTSKNRRNVRLCVVEKISTRE